MRHLDPDFKLLTRKQREITLNSLYLITKHSNEKRKSGLTQIKLVHSIGTSLLGIEDTKMDINYDRDLLGELKKEMTQVGEKTRHRIFQLFLLVELILDPMPKEASETLQSIAKILDISDDLLIVAREYSQGAYGIAATDLARKGYLGNPDVIKKGSSSMRVNKDLTDPFEVDENDTKLLQQWLDLEMCQTGTLGRNIWEYYMGRGFIFTGQKGSVNPTIAQHDWIHLLCDYNTTIEGELEVFSFIGSAIPDTKGFSFLIAIISLFETGRLESWGGGVLNADKGHLDLPGMPERVADAIRRGRECNRDVMYGIDYFKYKDMDIENVRIKLGIVPKDNSIDSPGVWDALGITDYQRSIGDPTYQPPLVDSIKGKK
jgi:hypothetical protein